MHWYSKLYIGEKAKNKKYKIVWKVKHGAGMFNVYLITLSSNGKNLLDIFNSSMLKQPYYKKTYSPRRAMYIVGIAYGYDEAVDVATEIINEVYNNTKGFEVEKYLLSKIGKNKDIT